MIKASDDKKLTLVQKFGNLDWALFFTTVVLALGGVACIYSATWTSDRPELRLTYEKQLMWMGVGVIACFIVSLIDYKHWLKAAWGLFATGVILLLLTLFLGHEIHGSKSWVGVGGFSVQPAEFCKLLAILFLAWFIGKQQGGEVKSFKTFAICCMVMGVNMVLILKQPDLGSAAVFIPVCFLMMFVGGVSKRWLTMGVLLGIVGAVLAFFFVLKDYQKLRLIVFLNPGHDVSGAGYHVNQSKIAIGSGGLTGKGFMEGTQNMLGFLPKNESFSDFIFSVVGEEFGFAGGCALVVVLSIVLMMGLNIALKARDTQGSLIAVGIVALFFAHIFENIGMTIGLTPVTGIPLPFISYGGTFLVACFLGVGLLQSVNVHKRSHQT